MRDDQARCAHKTVRHGTVPVGGGTAVRDIWICDLCQTEFYPEGAMLLEAATTIDELTARIEELERQREQADAHDDARVKRLQDERNRAEAKAKQAGLPESDKKTLADFEAFLGFGAGELKSLQAELERLRAWKRESLEVLGDWDKVAQRLDAAAGGLGRSLPSLVLERVEELLAPRGTDEQEAQEYAEAIVRDVIEQTPTVTNLTVLELRRWLRGRITKILLLPKAPRRPIPQRSDAPTVLEASKVPSMRSRGFTVLEWSPDDASKPEAIELAFLIELKDGQQTKLSTRFNSRAAVDQVIDLLESHKNSVWPRRPK